MVVHGMSTEKELSAFELARFRTPEEKATIEAARVLALQAKLPAAGKFTCLARLNAVPDRHRRLYLSAMAGAASMRQAVKAKCIECVGFEEIVPRIRDCRVYGCPLLPYRPFQEDSEDSAGDSEAN